MSCQKTLTISSTSPIVVVLGESEPPSGERVLPYKTDQFLLTFEGTYQFVSTGGDGPISWSVIAGALPPGMSLSSDGILSGTPTEEFDDIDAGDHDDPEVNQLRGKHYTFTVQATDGTLFGTAAIDLFVYLTATFVGSYSFPSGWSNWDGIGAQQVPNPFNFLNRFSQPNYCMLTRDFSYLGVIGPDPFSGNIPGIGPPEKWQPAVGVTAVQHSPSNWRIWNVIGVTDGFANFGAYFYASPVESLYGVHVLSPYLYWPIAGAGFPPMDGSCSVTVT